MTAPLQWAPKNAVEVLDYGIDWSPFLTPTAGDTIATSTWNQVSPPDAALVLGTETTGSDYTTVILSAGTPGNTYMLKNDITTVNGLTLCRTVNISIENCDGT